MTLWQILTFVFYSCIHMSYGSRQRRSTSATPQSLAKPPAALVACGRSARARQGMFHFSAPGVPVLEASPRSKASRSYYLCQDCIHCQIANHAGPPTPPLCGSHSAYIERHRQSRLKRDARSRTEAWLSASQSGRRGSFVCNISLIAYWIPSSWQPMKSWSPTSSVPHAIARR